MEKLLNELLYSNIDQVYFGKTGCACGCGGKYHDSQRMKKTAITRIKGRLNDEDNDVKFIKFKNSCEGVINWESYGKAIRIYIKDYNSLGL